nr:unnamed protein product [Spirometra erinaceieuropaei]
MHFFIHAPFAHLAFAAGISKRQKQSSGIFGRQTIRITATKAEIIAALNEEQTLVLKQMSEIVDEFLGIADEELAQTIFDIASTSADQEEFLQKLQENLSTFNFPKQIALKFWWAYETYESAVMNRRQMEVSPDWNTRLKGFACLFGIGVILSFLGNLFLWIPHTGLKLFALFYTLGNLCSLTSSFFLMGPVQQCKRMFAETRIIAASLVILFMVLTIVSAVVWGKALLCLLFSIFQFLALTWYSLSYIPLARDAVKRCCASLC